MAPSFCRFLVMTILPDAIAATAANACVHDDTTMLQTMTIKDIAKMEMSKIFGPPAVSTKYVRYRDGDCADKDQIGDMDECQNAGEELGLEMSTYNLATYSERPTGIEKIDKTYWPGHCFHNEQGIQSSYMVFNTNFNSQREPSSVAVMVCKARCTYWKGQCPPGQEKGDPDSPGASVEECCTGDVITNAGVFMNECTKKNNGYNSMRSCAFLFVANQAGDVITDAGAFMNECTKKNNGYEAMRSCVSLFVANQAPDTAPAPAPQDGKMVSTKYVRYPDGDCADADQIGDMDECQKAGEEIGLEMSPFNPSTYSLRPNGIEKIDRSTWPGHCFHNEQGVQQPYMVFNTNFNSPREPSSMARMVCKARCTYWKGQCPPGQEKGDPDSPGASVEECCTGDVITNAGAFMNECTKKNNGYEAMRSCAFLFASDQAAVPASTSAPAPVPTADPAPVPATPAPSHAPTPAPSLTITLTSVGSKQNARKQGSWTVTPTNGVIQDPAAFKDDGGGPYWAASCCDGGNKECGELTLNLENKYKLSSATLVVKGWQASCTVTCTLSDGAAKTFSTAGVFPSSCIGANEVRATGGGHCGYCYFKDVQVTRA